MFEVSKVSEVAKRCEVARQSEVTKRCGGFDDKGERPVKGVTTWGDDPTKKAAGAGRLPYATVRPTGWRGDSHSPTI